MDSMQKTATVPKRNPRGKRVQFWLPPAIAERMRDRADAAGLALSTWVKAISLRELKRRRLSGNPL